MRLWKLPDQVLRLGILFVIAIAALVIARQRFVPESFGELGHYRADALDEALEQPIRFAGAEACADCHDDVAEAKGQSYILPAGGFFEIRDGLISRITTYYNLNDWVRQVSR